MLPALVRRPLRAPHRVATRIATGPGLRHVAAGLILLATAPPARADRLSDLLDAVAANAGSPSPTRADARIHCEGDCPPSGRRAILLGRGAALYVEVEGGQRVLLRPGHRILVARDGAAAEAAVGEKLARTDILLEDLVPFTASALKLPQISDEGPAGVVVTAAPVGPSAYVLVVHTVDPERRVVVRTLYYRDLVNNLSKTRRDSGHVRAGGAWRPGAIEVQTMHQRTTTRLELTWRDAPDTPAALFEPMGLRTPSGLQWPARAD